MVLHTERVLLSKLHVFPTLKCSLRQWLYVYLEFQMAP